MEFRALTWLALPAMLMAQPDVVVRGVVHPLAQPRFDRGTVDAGFRLGYMRMMFGQTAAQRADLQRLLAAQRDPASPEYRQWLTPEQYADRFGLSAADLAAVTAWLTSAGFRIEYTARGRDWIAFSGTAAQVAAAFHTSIHRYQVRGKTHFANSSEPSLPSDVAPLVSTIFGLNDFHPYAIAKPAYTTSKGQTLAPGDLATIYDINRLYQQSIDGTGQSLVIVGQSEVDLSDVQQFRTAYGLGAQNIQVVATGTNPGFTPDLLEADLDLEWAGAIARGATLIYVYSTSADASVFYAIDQDLAPVISESFGVCEAEQPTSAAPEYEAEAQKGNALGITWLAASGDAGAAMCDLGESSASYGLAVSFPASIPEVTAVGGTEFNEGSTNYWSATNGPNGGSALGYIPEIAWNDTAYGGGLAATGGGVSTLFTKPTWQSGAGVPADGQRDVPDIAMAASNDHDPFNIVTSGQAQLVGGTSAAAPVMAGIIALLNQQLATNGVGNLNVTLYGLAASSSQMFHDIVSGNNIVPCVSGSPDCVNGTLGYYAGPGYDLTTGLGSVDGYNFVTGWSGGTSGVVITSLSPGAINAGASTLTLTVNGSGFASGATIEWNGAAQPTTLVSSTALTTVVSASLIASPATVAITVVSGGKTSGTLYFTVNPATPTGVSYSDQRVTTQAPAASGCVLPTAVTSFVTTQNTVYLYFSAVVSNSDSLSSDWLAPDGTSVSGGNWSQLSGDNCFTGASLSIANLPATPLGEWTARVYDNGALLFSVPFTVSAPGTAVPVITAVDNAASYTSGVVSPGEIVVILGTGLGPAQLAGLALDSSGLVSTQNSGTSVQFSGYPAPLVYTSATAIAAIVPYEVSGSAAQVTVTYQGKTSAAFSVNLAPSVPGIFTSDASSLGQAAAYNYQTGTFNSTTQPAAQGSTIILYATGEGQTSPGGIDGKPAAAPLPAPLLPVSVTIGGVVATVQYVGGAYGEVAGVLQLNVTVPTTVFGSAVPVVVQVGSAVTQTGVTIAVAESGGSGFAITSDEISGLLYATSGGELSCSTPPAQSSFLTTDPAVYLYFTFSGAQTGDVLSYNWVHPSGAIDADQPMQTIPFSGAGCTSESFPISGGAPAKEPGNWQVRVYHNGAFQFALTFTVINPAPSFTVSSQETAASVVTGANGNLTCTAPAAQSNFLSTSGGVWTYFAMQGAQLGDVIAFNWVHPSGQVDPYQPSFTLNFSGSGCAALAFPIAGTQAAGEPGAWQAQAFRNGTLLFSLPFTIAAPGFTVTSSEMTAALPTNANGSLNCAGTPVPQNVFPLTIADAYAWFTFSGGTAGDIISANWVNPSGGIDPDQPSLTLSFSGAGCIAMALPIQGYTTLTGAWQVKVFHNGLPLFALPFTIQP